MKIAARALNVYGAGGAHVIGALQCGDAVHVMGQSEQGVQIAYITGLIDPKDAQALLTKTQFEKKVKKRDKLIGFAAARQGRVVSRTDNGAELILACLTAAGAVCGAESIEEIWQACEPISKEALLAGDIVFMQRRGHMRCAGIWMADNTVLTVRRGGVVRSPFRSGKWNRFGRLLCLKCKKGGV